MKALSIRQPWIDLICCGDKRIEFRSRPTHYRGKLLICSSKFDEGYAVEIDGKLKALPLGVMLAIVDVIDSRPMTEADKDHPGAPDDIDGWHAWILDDLIDIVVPKPVRGSVNFFEVPDSLIESAPAGKFWYDYL